MGRTTGSARKAWQGATPSRDEQHRLKREAVVKAAARAFSRNGFHGTSLDQIAKELNVTKAALYYYVKNKGDILLACLGHAAAIGDAALDYGRNAGKTERYKRMLIEGDAGDIIYTDAFSGVPANMLKPSIRQFGLDPDNLPAKKALDVSKEMNVDVKAWRDIWTAGHGIGCIRDAPSVAELVARFRSEYAAALATPSWVPLPSGATPGRARA